MFDIPSWVVTVLLLITIGLQLHTEKIDRESRKLQKDRIRIIQTDLEDLEKKHRNLVSVAVTLDQLKEHTHNRSTGAVL